MRRILILPFILLFIGSTYAPDTILEQKWITDQGVKWSVDGDQYEESAIDTPDEGWFRSGTDYTIPGNWPAWATDRFNSLSLGLTDKDKEYIRLWVSPGLNIDTRWIDAKADKNNGAINVSIPTWQWFTYVLIDPPTGTIDQDFKGRAKVYGLSEDQTYRITAWDAVGLLGQSLTAISDKYIHVLPDSSDLLGTARTPAMGQKVVEDPNRDLWAFVYQPVGLGALFQFVDIYSLKAEGDIQSKFRVPITASYVRPWLTDLILEDNGDVTFSACEDPMGLSSYLGPSFVARLDRAGNTVWQTPQTEISPAICIIPLNDGGYAYGGATFSTDPLYIDKQLGSLVRLTSTGSHTPWGATGTTYVTKTYSIRDIKKATQEDCEISGTTTQYNPVDCDTFMITAGSCADTYDNNYATYASGEGDNITAIIFDLGVTRTITRAFARFRFRDGTGLEDAAVHMSGTNSSNPGWADPVWTWLIPERLYVPAPLNTWLEIDANLSGGSTYRYFMIDADINETTVDYAEFNLSGDQPGECQSGISTYYYVGGRANTGGERIFEPASNQADCSAVSQYSTSNNCCLAVDGIMNDPANYVALFNINSGCGWNEAGVTATVSKVWYHTNDPTNILLQQFGGGAWNTVASTAATVGAGAYLWTATFAAVSSAQWRVIIDSAVGDEFRLYEWQLYPASSGGGIIAKYTLEGAQSGSEFWNTKYLHPESGAGIFNAVAVNPRVDNRIYAFGSSESSTINLNLNKGIGLCVTRTGSTVWQRDYPQVSEFYDASPTEDGGFLLAGTLYTGTSVQQRSAVVLKIDKDGNVDSKFPQTFKDENKLGNDGRGVIETRDGGILMIGGSSSEISRSQPYFVKLDRFYRPCSSGAPCE